MRPAGYIDLQVNGYGGVDFNRDDLSADDLHRACRRLRDDGVQHILATVITEDLERMIRRLRAIAALRKSDELAQSVIAGIHIEGPFINETPGYHGAHPPDAIRPADVDAMARLLDAADGLTRIVTLAPERDPQFRVTRMLASRGIVVSAGHTNASLDELDGAIDAGLSMFTHVGNGCPATLPRHDNIVQRVLSRADRIWCCFIADGAHIPFFALRNYLKLADLSRSIVVTDAIAPAGLGPGTYTLARWKIQIGEDMVARSPDGSHLLGAAITMSASENNLKSKVGLTDQHCRQLLIENPAKAIRLAV